MLKPIVSSMILIMFATSILVSCSRPAAFASTTILSQNFDNEPTGSCPQGWTDSNQNVCSFYVNDTIYHGSSGKSVEYNDMASYPYGYSIVQTFFEKQNGMLEFSFSLMAENPDYFSFYIDDGTPMCRGANIYFLPNMHFAYYDGNYNYLSVFSDNTWYDIKFVINITANTYDIYIDGSLDAQGAHFRGFGQASYLTRIQVGGNSYEEPHAFIDDLLLTASPDQPPYQPPANIPSVSVQPENLTVESGKVFSINITIENIPAYPGMVGVQFEMSWDPTILNATNMTEVMFHNVAPPSEWDNIWQLENTINNTAGTVFYAYTWQDGTRAINGGYSPIAGNYTLATITFQSLGTGSTILHLWNLVVGDPIARCLICSPDTGHSPMLSSAIQDGNTTVLSLKGDLNGDGIVDLYDAMLLAQHLGSTQGDPKWDARADINGDGKVDVFDAIILAQNFGKTT